MRDNGMMEAFRVDDLLFLSFPKVRRESTFLLFLCFLDTSGPRLKDCRGDDLLFLSFPKFFIGNPCFCFFFLSFYWEG